MILEYIESLCGNDNNFGGYNPATLIQAIINSDGALSPVDKLLAKLEVFLDEYNSEDILIIIAEKSRSELIYNNGSYIIGKHSISSENIKFAKDTKELCEKTFAKWNELIANIWTKISPDFIKSSLLNGFMAGWSINRIEQEFLIKSISAPDKLLYSEIGNGNGLKLSYHYNTVNKFFDIRLGFDENIFKQSYNGENINESVIIAIDGSAFADSLWSLNQGSYPISQMIFEIIRFLPEAENYKFFIHFLSNSKPDDYIPGNFENSNDLHKFLEEKRRVYNTQMKGNYISPIIDYWSNRRIGHKQLIVITDGPVFDYNDFNLSDYFQRNLCFCLSNNNKKFLTADYLIVDKNNIQNFIYNTLAIPLRKIQKAVLKLNDWVPYQWNASDIILKIDAVDNQNIFEYDNINNNNVY